jgi:hypothetical protein
VVTKAGAHFGGFPRGLGHIGQILIGEWTLHIPYSETDFDAQSRQVFPLEFLSGIRVTALVQDYKRPGSPLQADDWSIGLSLTPLASVDPITGYGVPFDHDHAAWESTHIMGPSITYGENSYKEAEPEAEEQWSVEPSGDNDFAKMRFFKTLSYQAESTVLLKFYANAPTWMSEDNPFTGRHKVGRGRWYKGLSQNYSTDRDSLFQMTPLPDLTAGQET